MNDGAVEGPSGDGGVTNDAVFHGKTEDAEDLGGFVGEQGKQQVGKVAWGRDDFSDGSWTRFPSPARAVP